MVKVISDVDANNNIQIEQQTKSVDNQEVSCSPRSPDFSKGSQDLLDALNHFTKENTSEQIKPCAQILFMYTMNLSSNPNLP